MCIWRAGDGVRVKVVHGVTLRCSEPKDKFFGFFVVVMLELSSRALVLLSFARSFFINLGRSLESLLSYQTKVKFFVGPWNIGGRTELANEEQGWHRGRA